MFNLGILSASQHGPTGAGAVEFITSKTGIGMSLLEPAHNPGDLIILFAATGWGDSINNPNGYTTLNNLRQGSFAKLTTLLSYKVGTGTPVSNTMNFAGTIGYIVLRGASSNIDWLRTFGTANTATSPAITPSSTGGIYLNLLSQHKDRNNPINPTSGLTTIWNFAGSSGSNREDNDAQRDLVLTTTGLQIPSYNMSPSSSARPFAAYSLIINPA